MVENEMGISKDDLFDLLVVYLCRTHKSWKVIEELYNKKFEECVEVLDDSKSRFNYLTIKQEPIEVRFYINRLAALIILDERNGNIDNFMTVLRGVFKKAYKYVVSVNKIKVGRYWDKHINTELYIDDIYAEILALLFFINVLGKEVDTKDGIYVFLIQVFNEFRYVMSNNDEDRCAYGYENRTEAVKLLIDEIADNLRSSRFKDEIDFEEYRKCNSKAIEAYESGEIESIELFDRIGWMNTHAVDLTMNTIDMISLLNNIVIDKNRIKDYISLYLYFTPMQGEEINPEDITVESMAPYIYNFIMQDMMTKVYKRTADFFFDNYDEQSNAIQKRIVNENNSLKSQVSDLSSDNIALKNEIEELKRKLNKADKELDDSNSNNKELFELRNYVFKNQNETIEDIEVDTYDLEYLKGKNIVCFGGNNIWISSMNKEFDWTFISQDSLNFDTRVLSNADIVIIKATNISHSMYYKVISNIHKDTQIKFINGSNINKIKYELSNA